MANFVFVEYNPQNGRYMGHSYCNQDPELTNNNSIRKLTVEEARHIGTEYEEYRYNEAELIKLPELHFVVSPNSTYQIGRHNKICLWLTRSMDTPDSEYEQIKDNEYKITVNGQEVMLKFGEMVFIDPKQAGIYTFELVDERVFAKKTFYTVTVLDPPPE